MQLLSQKESEVEYLGNSQYNHSEKKMKKAYSRESIKGVATFATAVVGVIHGMD